MGKKFLPLLALASISLAVPFTALAARLVFLTSFNLHDNDATILAMMGYGSEDASVLYFREMGSITTSESQTRKQYEPIGCDPFYVMSQGKKVETGYNCRSFACVGYTAGPKQCKDVDGNAYGGVSEINRRLNITYIQDTEKTFSEFTGSELTAAMQDRIAELSPLKCTPFYLMSFDVVVGEGYRCTEVGRYPYYSGANRCMDDWRKEGGLTCDISYRSNEMELRRQYLGLPPTGSSSSSSMSSSSVSSSRSSVSSSSSSSVASARIFTDVEVGKYGYTAIVSLAAEGIIEGYDDGTFRPNQTINRAEFSKMLLGGLFPEEIGGENSCFPDVREEWFASFVCAARRLGWIRGYGDGRFRPNQTITKAEAVKIVVESLDLPLASTGPIPFNLSPKDWYTPYIRKAVEAGIILEPSFLPSQQTTRADAAVWIYRAAKARGDL